MNKTNYVRLDKEGFLKELKTQFPRYYSFAAIKKLLDKYTVPDQEHCYHHTDNCKCPIKICNVCAYSQCEDKHEPTQPEPEDCDHNFCRPYGKCLITIQEPKDKSVECKHKWSFRYQGNDPKIAVKYCKDCGVVEEYKDKPEECKVCAEEEATPCPTCNGACFGTICQGCQEIYPQCDCKDIEKFAATAKKAGEDKPEPVYCGGDHCSQMWNLDCNDPKHDRSVINSNKDKPVGIEKLPTFAGEHDHEWHTREKLNDLIDQVNSQQKILHNDYLLDKELTKAVARLERKLGS